jgi:phosphoglucomutase/phosphomannomutase
MSLDIGSLQSRIQQAVAAGKLTESAAKNITAWLTELRYADYAAEVAAHVEQEKWKPLDDAFWTVIPFGTGGRRGRMYPIGSNAINDRTIGESAQGLATYVKKHVAAGAELACAIGYDTRHRSRQFAELCAEVMAANGFRVYFLDGVRSTPQVSFTVRHKHCACGIMVSASHNPPSDNAVKAYWAGGVQVLPPHDKGVIDEVMACTTIARMPFAAALAEGKVAYCQQESDAAYLDAVQGQSFAGPRDLKIIYSPLHGVGAVSILPLLERDGFKNVELFAPHAEPNGDFPNVPGHVSNPENPAVFDAMIARAKETGAELILATDPDADRLGAAAPLKNGGGEWRTLSGNQIGVLLIDYVLERRKAAGSLTPVDYVVKTLVTTDMIVRIADSYGMRTIGDLHVGFKFIGRTIDEQGPAGFLIGAEESHGYLVGTHARDKDANVAAMLLAELAARCKSEGMTLHERLDALFWQHGCHVERLLNQSLPGSEGMATMRKLMERFRTAPPATLGGMKIARARDFLNLTSKTPDGKSHPLSAEKGDMVVLDFDEPGNFVAVRPSGTEPKVKYYMFAFEPAELLHNLETTKAELNARLDAIEKDVQALAGSL